MNEGDAPVWFVTGCSSGFGRALATLVIAAGHPLVATARSPGDIQDLAEGSGRGILPLSLDVTRQSDIDRAVEAAVDRFGRIDVLVNNAGYGYRATVEDGVDSEIRRMFESNVFGLFAVTRAVLPGMRARRRGHVVNISSIAGLAGNVGTGYYAASKHAVEGFSDALWHEVQPLGLKVTCVEPGPFRTDFAGRSIRETPVSHPDYASAQERMQRMRETSGRQPGDPVKAAQAILDIALRDDAPRHLLLGAVALEVARAKLERLRQDMEAWESVTLAADFPPGAG